MHRVDALSEEALALLNALYLAEPLRWADPDHAQRAAEEVHGLLSIQTCPLPDDDGDMDDDLDEAVAVALLTHEAMAIPPRQHVGTFAHLCPELHPAVAQRLRELRAIPQPDQRTPAWYAFRMRYLTASSAWKAFGTESARNQLVYDKCQVEPPRAWGVNVESPMHWGQKYEPVSVMWYEAEYRTKVGEFGCIPHPDLECLAASPDGINIDPDNARYGRMLEIKNVVSREITGIPKKDYWIQMQLQMAVCGLPMCDFLEMKFIEYADEEEAEADGDWGCASSGALKGMIMHFMVDGSPVYEYMPLRASRGERAEWEAAMQDAHANDTWIRNIFWRLDKISCVLVEFNPSWMGAAATELQSVWRTIKRERVQGCEHRAPKRRRKEPALSDGTRTAAYAPQCILSLGDTDDPVVQSGPVHPSLEMDAGA